MITSISGRRVIFERLSINEAVFYAIKSTTSESENEIVAWIYDLAMTLFNDAVSSNKRLQRVNRTVTPFYKNTDIQIRLQVSSSYIVGYYAASSSHPIRLFFTVSSPTRAIHLDGSKVQLMLLEQGLTLNDEAITTVKKPKEKKYKCMHGLEDVAELKVTTKAVDSMQDLVQFLPEALKIKYLSNT